MIRTLFNPGVTPTYAPRTSAGSAKVEPHADFATILANSMGGGPGPSQISASSPLVRLRPRPEGVATDYYSTLPGGTSTSPIAGGPDDIKWPNPDGANSYSFAEVGRIDRAPMAMFEHDDELVLSSISRNGMSETPVWTYSPATGVKKASNLPEVAESGHYGYSTGDGIHLTPESWGGAIDYTAPGPEGPWEVHDYTDLVPHDYTNLKWGFSYQCPRTGREFMGFGNTNHPGMVLSKDNGDWELFSAPEDMRFPTGIGVVDKGVNKDTVLVSSNYGGTRIHAIDPDGSTRLVTKFDGWGVLRADHVQKVFYVGTDKGKVYWASFDNPDDWKECRYIKPSGEVDHIETVGEPNLHPQTGRMLFPAMDAKQGATGVYEARRDGDDMVLEEVAWISVAGQWAAKSAVAGGRFYVGTGVDSGLANDRTPGAIYSLELA